MTDDVLKKPVHEVLHKSTQIRELHDKKKDLMRTVESSRLQEAPSLPKEEKKKKPGLVQFQSLNSRDIRKKNMIRAHLRVVHDNFPDFPKGKEPPCDTCKTAACCRAFVVSITEKEYESGLYGDHAVKITPEIARQFKSGFSQYATFGGPELTGESNYYYLDGKIGEPCPFLGDDNNCTIYDYRPVVCRAYSCVDDERITEEHRSGEEPLFLSEEYMLAGEKAK